MGDPTELNFEGPEIQKRNIPTDRAQRVDHKNRVICLAIRFTSRVMVIKMSKMVHSFSLWSFRFYLLFFLRFAGLVFTGSMSLDLLPFCFPLPYFSISSRIVFFNELSISFSSAFLSYPFLLRSSLPEVFCKKGVLKNFAKFTRTHMCLSLFFNIVAGLGLQLY